MPEDIEPKTKDPVEQAPKSEDGQSVLDLQVLNESDQAAEVQAHGSCLSFQSVLTTDR